MLMVNELVGFGAGSSRAASLAFVSGTNLGDGAGPGTGASKTFSSVSFGAEDEDRTLILATFISTAGVPSMDSVTIGGVTATQVLTTGTSNSAVFLHAVKNVPGTSGSIVVDPSIWHRMGIGLWRVTGLDSLTPYNTANDNSGPFGVSLNIPANGFAICFQGTFQTPFTQSWSGLTKDFDGAASSNTQWSGASGIFASAQTGYSVTSTTGTTQFQGFGASWAFAV